MSDLYEIAEISSAVEWDDFVGQATGGSIFSTWAWLRCAQEATGYPFRCHGCYKNGRLVAAVSGLEQRRWRFTRFTTPELTPHGGFLFAAEAGKGPAKSEAAQHRSAALLMARLVQEYHHIQLVHTPAIADLREGLWAGWTARIRYTYQLDLNDREALWERLERRTRTVIRKAEKAGFQLCPTDDLDLFRRQYEQLYARQEGPPPVPSSTVQRFARQALDAGLAEAWAIASATGQIAAIVIFVRDFEMIHAWIAGADPAFNPTGAISLLYWEFFARTAFRRFDFGGANLPSIAHFKRGFGGELVPYYVLEGYKNAPLRTLFALRRALS